MARPSKYTDDERLNALAALAANGGNVARTAAEIKMPRKTLALWAMQLKASQEAAATAETGCPQKDPSPSRLMQYERKKGELADKLEAIAHQLVDTMSEKIEKAGLQQVAVSLGITIEKMRLLREQSTSNNGGTFRLEFERLAKLPYDELLRLHRATLGVSGDDRN